MLALTSVLISTFVLANVASAGEYQVEVCTPTAHETEFLSVAANPGTTGLTTAIECGTPSGVIRQLTTSSPYSGGVRWNLEAPADTKIRGLDLDEVFSSPWDFLTAWSLTGEERIQATELGVPPNGHVHLRISPTIFVQGSLGCRQAPCTTRAEVGLANIVVTLEDNALPGFIDPLGGSLLAGGRLRGIKEVTFKVQDEGSGVSGSLLVLDGVEGPFVPDQNGGRCVEPIRFMHPCKSELTGSFQVDTTRLSEGQHELRVAAFDAAHNRTESALVTFTVHNTPTNTRPPVLQGTATLGQKMGAGTGTWEGDPTTYAIQWLRCPPNSTDGNETGCAEIPGATAPDYSIRPADVESRLRVRVTATNATGSDRSLSVVTPVVTKADDSGGGKGPGDARPPELSGLSLTHKRFRVGNSPTAISARAKAPRGTALRFTSSEVGTLTVAIAKVLKGKKTKPAGTLTRKISAGPGKLSLSGRIGRKALKAGRYQVTVSARDGAGNVSKEARLSFTILPG